MDSSRTSSRSSTTELSIEEAEKVEAVLLKAGLLHLKPKFVQEKFLFLSFHFWKAKTGIVWECLQLVTVLFLFS
ncbi:hypothetical protein GBAR_LOCUS8471 [Geodia barretti]|uniref:Uncharacterized protein n=1 Tax=Geodia barretti TaxID=519541 RepID=A0AA35RMK8_GEOBA|nr:hypothetical protein GBAR_LOCUS8471 [Geodia barretti]